MSSAVGGEVLAVVALIGTLVWAVARPRGLPEAVAAVPAALLVCLVGGLSWSAAGAELVRLAPTVAFLGAILALGHLCADEGVFAALGARVLRRSRGSARSLFHGVFVIAALVTAVLSLDATVVFLTPVVLAVVARSRLPATPPLFAVATLANSASLLLPVSNLTNLLAWEASGLGFAQFAVLMAGPWLAALGVQYLVMRWRYRAELVAVRGALREQADSLDVPSVPWASVVVLGLTLVGFLVSSAWGVEPFWVALAGVMTLLAVRLRRRGASARGAGAELVGVVRGSDPVFLVFVLALAVVVAATVQGGLGSALGSILPPGDTFLDLLLFAGVAAVLANLVNNLPAVLLLIPLVAATAPGPLPVLAVLVGVGVGPNLTYVGSLATLLWRRVLLRHDRTPSLREFTVLGLLTVPCALLTSTCALWLSGMITSWR